jgi:hypothetical protein
MPVLKCNLCGHVGLDVKVEPGKKFRCCCEDYSACEKRRQEAAAEQYRKQKPSKKAL